MDLRSRRPSVSVVVGMTALVVALSGTAYGQDAVTAAAKLVKNGNLATNAVTSAKVKDGSLLAKDFKSGQLPAGARGADGAQGSQGPRGQQGLQGVAGPGGARGPSDAFSAFRDTQASVPTGGTQQPVLTLTDLPAGRYVIVAKATVNNGTNTERYVSCRLTAGTDTDDSDIGVGTNAGFLDLNSVSLTVVHEFGAPGSAVLSCNNNGATANDTLVGDRKITAIRVESLVNTAAAAP